ncbi:hematopoietic death receptor isoform X2 [Eleginops maclovinus]|uniref:hematopoietic death receptor isoform X2 n=1 Tax=Eleginops maclovinus TaxID=56733 RepID=UPI003080D82E
MTRTVNYLVSVLFCCLGLTAAFPQSGLSSCRDDEYPHGNICCKNCPAGKRVAAHCSTAGGVGQCEECDDGTFTEHDNGLQQCFKCPQCRSDQEAVQPCTHTQETECQCRAGRFCAPDQPCEVCKKCSSCAQDEETVRNCTSTTNTECKKNPPKSDSDSEKASLVLPLLLLAFLITAGAIFAVWRHRRAKESQGHTPDGLKAGQLNSASPSEGHSNGEPRRQSCSILLHPPSLLEEQPFPKLVPEHGEDSLRKCFQFFEELDYTVHKRFFRNLDVSDNEIKSKELLLYEDKIHDLLNTWVEMKGRDASLNDLLRALLDLNQRRTAEKIKEKALQYGHYTCPNLEDERSDF